MLLNQINTLRKNLKFLNLPLLLPFIASAPQPQCATLPAALSQQRFQQFLSPVQLEVDAFSSFKNLGTPCSWPMQFSGGLTIPMTWLPLFGWEKNLSLQVRCDGHQWESNASSKPPVIDVGCGFRAKVWNSLWGLSGFCSPTLQTQSFQVGEWGLTAEYLQKHLKISTAFVQVETGVTSRSIPPVTWLPRIKGEIALNPLLPIPNGWGGLKQKIHGSNLTVELDINRSLDTRKFLGFHGYLGKIFGIRMNCGIWFDCQKLFNGRAKNIEQGLPVVHFKLFATSRRSPIYNLNSAKDFEAAKVGSFLTVSRTVTSQLMKSPQTNIGTGAQDVHSVPKDEVWEQLITKVIESFNYISYISDSAFSQSLINCHDEAYIRQLEPSAFERLKFNDKKQLKILRMTLSKFTDKLDEVAARTTTSELNSTPEIPDLQNEFRQIMEQCKKLISNEGEEQSSAIYSPSNPSEGLKISNDEDERSNLGSGGNEADLHGKKSITESELPGRPENERRTNAEEGSVHTSDIEDTTAHDLLWLFQETEDGSTIPLEVALPPKSGKTSEGGDDLTLTSLKNVGADLAESTTSESLVRSSSLRFVTSSAVTSSSKGTNHDSDPTDEIHGCSRQNTA